MYSVQIEHLFLNLGGVLKNTLGLQSPAGFFKSPCLYTRGIVSGLVQVRDEALDGTLASTYEVSGLKTYATPATKKLPMKP